MPDCGSSAVERCQKFPGCLLRAYPAVWLAFEPADGMPDGRCKGFLIRFRTR